MELWNFRTANLMGATDLQGMSVEAVDGKVGRVVEFVDDLTGAFMVVDTGPWIFGKTVVLPAGLITAVDPEQQSIAIDRTKDEVRDAPEIEPAAAADVEGRRALTDHYSAGRDDALASGGLEGGDTLAGPDQGFGSDTRTTPFTESAVDLPATPAEPPAAPSESSPWSDAAGETAPAAPRGGEASSASPLGGESFSPTPEASRPDAHEDSTARLAADVGTEQPAAPQPESEQIASDLGGAERDTDEDARATPDEGRDRADETTPATGRFGRDTGTATSRPASESGSGDTSGRKASGRSTPTRKSSGGMPIARYDKLTAAEVIARLRSLSQRELTEVERHEKRHEKRQTVLERIDSLREREPWRGYDDATVAEIRHKLSDANEDLAKAVRDYERRHRERKGVMTAARRTVASA